MKFLSWAQLWGKPTAFFIQTSYKKAAECGSTRALQFVIVTKETSHGYQLMVEESSHYQFLSKNYKGLFIHPFHY